MNHWQTTLAIIAVLSASIVAAEDFKTTNGKDYKYVTVSRVEPDGIVLKSKKEHKTVQEQGAMIARQQKQIEALTAGLQKVSAQLEMSTCAPRTVLNDH